MVKLETRQIIKNYKMLCELLGVVPSSGNTKISQLKDFERYCTYHKDGNKYIIDEVFSTPKEKIDERKNNGGHIANTKYDLLMDDIIIDILLHQGCEISASFTDMFSNYIPIFSDEYSDGKKHGFKYLEKKNNISIGLITTYSNKIKDMVKGNFETTLNRLQKKGLLTWSNEYIVMKSSVLEREFATEKEVAEIKKVEKETYKELEMKPYHRINQDKNKKFRDYAISLLQEYDADIFSYWKVYSIVADDSIENIEPVAPDIKELTNRYINSIHNKVMNHTINSKEGKPFKPYIAEKHIRNLLKLDLLFLEQYKGLEYGFNLDDDTLDFMYYTMGDTMELETADDYIDEETGISFPF